MAPRLLVFASWPSSCWTYGVCETTGNNWYEDGVCSPVGFCPSCPVNSQHCLLWGLVYWVLRTFKRVWWQRRAMWGCPLGWLWLLSGMTLCLAHTIWGHNPESNGITDVQSDVRQLTHDVHDVRVCHSTENRPVLLGLPRESSFRDACVPSIHRGNVQIRLGDLLLLIAERNCGTPGCCASWRHHCWWWKLSHLFVVGTPPIEIANWCSRRLLEEPLWKNRCGCL